MAIKTIEIRGVWILKKPRHLGDQISVVVELADGTMKEVISEISDDGPISHYVHPAGINTAPDWSAKSHAV